LRTATSTTCKFSIPLLMPRTLRHVSPKLHVIAIPSHTRSSARAPRSVSAACSSNRVGEACVPQAGFTPLACVSRFFKFQLVPVAAAPSHQLRTVIPTFSSAPHFGAPGHGVDGPWQHVTRTAARWNYLTCVLRSSFCVALSRAQPITYDCAFAILYLRFSRINAATSSPCRRCLPAAASPHVLQSPRVPRMC